jgi:hypothetical protein
MSCVIVGLIVLAAPLQGAPAVELERWYDKAVFVPNTGPGEEYFRLVAVARWASGAPRDPARYGIRVTLPNGQGVSRPLVPGDRPGAGRITFLVPSAAVRNPRPTAVVVQAIVVEQPGDRPVSNVLEATIDDFPTPDVGASTEDTGPFGWGRPLEGPPGRARPLPRPGPDGLRFVRVLPDRGGPGLFVAAAESTVGQVKARLKGYDPKAGRSDEFHLEDPDQPAINLAARQAEDYLRALARADRAGVAYRLPTRDEWLRLARAGRASAFWWGDEPSHPAGANFLGPEPALKEDTTATSPPAAGAPAFRPNPWGLYHTFGNAAEWAREASGSYVRMGGHFRTEPASPLPPQPIVDPASVGDDPYVGVRPVFSLTAEQGADLARKALHEVPGLAGVAVSFDPDRATVTLAGRVADSATRRQAERRLAGLWFVAAVEDRLAMPTIAPGGLALLGPVAGPARPTTTLGRRLDQVPLRVRWASPLPVDGSEWYVNIYGPGGAHFAHALAERRPSPSRKLVALIDRARIPAGAPVSVALSLGAPAPTPQDPRIVSNVLPLGAAGP